MGVKVTLVEFLPNVVPNEDEEVSKQVERAFKKLKMTVMTEASVTHVDTTGEKCVCTIATKKGEKTVEADIVLSAVGVQTNIDNLGLEELGITTERGQINHLFRLDGIEGEIFEDHDGTIRDLAGQS